MGKNKTKHNVFKVAGARSLKAKNIAKAVTVSLKKITKNIVQSKTEEINRQLKSLDEVVRQSGGESAAKKIIAEVAKPTVVAGKSHEEIVKDYESEMKKEEETVSELEDLSVGAGGKTE